VSWFNLTTILFICNMTTSHRSKILGAEVEFIPAGYTSVLQAMDKGLHKPFKQYPREESLSWMVRQPDGAKPT
jgi:hypothetical protein